MSEPPIEAEHSEQPAPAPAPEPKSGGGASAAVGLSVAAAAVLAKSKGALLFLKAMPLGKLLLSSGTMVLSMLAYAAQGGWKFGVGLVLLILLHELGHGAAMKRAGVQAGWPVFIPFFGAMIAMQGRPAHPCVEADIAFAGPMAGTAASLACAGLGLFWHDPFWIGLAYTGFFLNLFNLVPFGFLDGGRVARVLSRKASIVGAIVLGLLFLKSPSPQLLMIAALGTMHAFRSASDPDLALVTPEQKSTWSFRYFGLCAFLGACTLFSHQLIAR